MKSKIALRALIPVLLLLSFLGCTLSGPSSQVSFGITAAQEDLWEEAIYRWKKTLKISPGSAAAHNNLAVAYEYKGLIEEAKKEYEAALKLDPKNRYINSNFVKFKEIFEEKMKGKNEKD